MERVNATVFTTVANEGSYRRAADKLGYTQAGISYIINRMEEEVGFTFFVREYGGVHLTPEGEKLLPFMQRDLDTEIALNEQIDRINGLETGHVRIISFNTVIICWLPDIVEGFYEKYPGITVEISTCDGPEKAISMLENNEADCGFIDAERAGSIDLFPLREEPDVAVVGEGHPLAGRKLISVEDLGEYPFIGASEEEMPYIYKMVREKGVRLRQLMTVNTDYGSL